jgi:hypothetical protein
MRTRRKVRADAVLADLYALAAQHPGVRDHAHAVSVLQAMQPRNVGIAGSLRALEDGGWAREVRPGQWALTSLGFERARTLFLPGMDAGEVAS